MRFIFAILLFLWPVTSVAAPLWNADKGRVEIDQTLLDSLTNKSATEFSLPVNGREFLVQVDRVSEPNLGVTSLRGHMEKQPESFFLLCRTDGGATVAFFQPGDGTAYRLDHTLGYDSVHAVSFEEFGACGGGLTPPVLAIDAPGSEPTEKPTINPDKFGETADDGSRHDVLIAYTTAAEAFMGGWDFIRAEAQLSIDAANLAYANSGIVSELRLVHAMGTSYEEISAFTYNQHLEYLWHPSDGRMDEVLTMRETVGADFISILIDGRELTGTVPTCGIAYTMDSTLINQTFAPAAHSIVSVQCAVSNWTFAHEVGHNRGCTHNRENSANPAAYAYSYGHRWTGFRSVMSYDNSAEDFVRIPHFSNPAVSYNGTPTGVLPGSADQAHNALTHNNTRNVCAAFRTERTFVEFGWVGTSSGLLLAPFSSLAQGLATSRLSGTLVIRNSNAAFTGIMSTPQSYVHDGNGSAVLGGS